jgi:peptide deformylase
MVEYIDEAFDGSNDEINPGIAIAAPQVGLLKKVIYVHFLDNNEIEHKYLLANPKIVAESKAISYIPHGEGCLSVPSHHNGIVKRRNKVQIKAFDLVEKKNITINASGMLSICLQHEIDHLYGILYYDRINKEDKNFIGED